MLRQFSASPAFSTQDGTQPYFRCRKNRSVQEYYRKGKVWKGCNERSAKDTARQQMLQLQQQYAELQYQRQVEQQLRQQEQGDPRMALNFLRDNTDGYTPSSLQSNEQSRRLIHQTQHFFDPQIFSPASVAEKPVSHQNPQTELYFEPFQNHPPQSMAGVFAEDMLPEYDLNLYCNPGSSASAHQSNFFCNYSWPNLHFDPSFESGFEFTSTEVPAIGFDQCLANASANDCIELQNNDDGNIFYEPATPKHDLTGGALAKHLIRQIGLAARLLALHDYLCKIRNPNMFVKQVVAMVREKQDRMTIP
ncbi:uncharacterized protein M421DRAFT_6431 [Didymella exigua CBS 183.55]|uniref:Uncharacterized protein n=1 Tax=Didymella exigua CBS 183.55 TaxID=1150837 RepID=A0A6A5RG02_9PLEO|nr:uncharacterized protein M421DRAFT_6431 [Didymella exigua CBS 183.55]KAF1927241.1 hypothetical protein M421DRAFT_6431 [Didymella exigua CBS 183.55]